MSGYDEFGLFHENAAEYGIELLTPPVVRRESVMLDSGLSLSALVWGEGDPELVLVHGGAQNAHTWDTVALALGRPLVAVDLPGHGRSDHRPTHNYSPLSMADDLAVAAERLAPNAEAVVGMSLGGMVSICLAADHPHLVRRLGIVDVTPGVDHAKAEPVLSFVDGPEHFESFEVILARTVEFNPGRSESSLRRGILHNAHELPDGRWVWNYDRVRGRRVEASDEASDGVSAARRSGAASFEDLWDKVDEIEAPIALWQGGRWSVIDDSDVAEWMRRRPDTRHVVVEGAGHSIQGDRPIELAALIEDLLVRPAPVVSD